MKIMWTWEFALKYANVYHSCSFFVGMTPWLLHPALHRWMQQRCGSLSSLLESQLQATQLWYAWVVVGWLTLLAIFSFLFLISCVVYWFKLLPIQLCSSLPDTLNTRRVTSLLSSPTYPPNLCDLAHAHNCGGGINHRRQWKRLPVA